MLIGLALSHQVVQSAKALQWIMDSLKSRGFTAQGAQPSCQKMTSLFALIWQLKLTQTYCTFPPLLSALIFLPTVSMTTDKPSYTSASEKVDRCHINARQFYYPDSKVTRFPVPEEKVPWQVIHHSKDLTTILVLCQTSRTAHRPVTGELHRVRPNTLLRKGGGHPGRVGHCVVAWLWLYSKGAFHIFQIRLPSFHFPSTEKPHLLRLRLQVVGRGRRQVHVQVWS